MFQQTWLITMTTTKMVVRIMYCNVEMDIVIVTRFTLLVCIAAHIGSRFWNVLPLPGNSCKGPEQCWISRGSWKGLRVSFISSCGSMRDVETAGWFAEVFDTTHIHTLFATTQCMMFSTITTQRCRVQMRLSAKRAVQKDRSEDASAGMIVSWPAACLKDLTNQ